MKQKGVPNYLIKVIHSYLSDRFGYVQLRQTRSRVLNIKAGCIQGSVLGPILFNILVSELDKIVSPNKTVAYADDAYIIISAKNPNNLEQHLNTTLNKHLSWLKDIGMICNAAKTEIMVLGDLSITTNLDGAIINSQNTLKVLGVMFDSALKWNNNTQKIISKCRSYLYGLRYLRRHLNITEIAKILKAQIVSIMTYGAPAWYHRIDYTSRLKLRSTYYHIIRVMLRDFNRKMNRSGLLKASGMENIDNIMSKRTSCFAFKLIHDLNPTNLTSIILSKSYCNERSPEYLSFFDTSQRKIGKACLSNQLPKIVKDWKFPWLSCSLNEFKNNLAAQFNKTTQIQ